MRKHKFRLYNKQTRSYIMPNSNTQISTNGEIYRDGLNVTDIFIIEQFTGLYDKEEKEIYEGDIRSGSYKVLSDEFEFFDVMTWIPESCCFRWSSKRKHRKPFYMNTVVTGNIHENKDGTR